MRSILRISNPILAGVSIAIINTLCLIFIAPYAPSGMAIGSLFVPLLFSSFFTQSMNIMLQSLVQSDAFKIFLISSVWGIGTIIGSYISAITSGRFKFRRFNKLSGIRSLSGGLLMGIGIALMSGCNVFHVFGGLPLFVPTSILATFGIVIGALFALRLYQMILKRYEI